MSASILISQSRTCKEKEDSRSGRDPKAGSCQCCSDTLGDSLLPPPTPPEWGVNQMYAGIILASEYIIFLKYAGINRGPPPPPPIYYVLQAIGTCALDLLVLSFSLLPPPLTHPLLLPPPSLSVHVTSTLWRELPGLSKYNRLKLFCN
jgi:hypothetical protein